MTTNNDILIKVEGLKKYFGNNEVVSYTHLPVKISGTCGRLMCCLKYEQDAYTDLLKKTPKVGAIVNTPDGDVYKRQLIYCAVIAYRAGNANANTFNLFFADVLFGKFCRNSLCNRCV